MPGCDRAGGAGPVGSGALGELPEQRCVTLDHGSHAATDATGTDGGAASLSVPSLNFGSPRSSLVINSSTDDRQDGLHGYRRQQEEEGRGQHARVRREGGWG